jgi:ferredoxin
VIKLVVDRVLCQGYGQCEAVAPTLFQLDADIVAVVLKTPETAEEIGQAREAVRVCPRQAIRLEEVS